MIRRSSRIDRLPDVASSTATICSSVISLLPDTCHSPVNPGRTEERIATASAGSSSMLGNSRAADRPSTCHPARRSRAEAARPDWRA